MKKIIFTSSAGGHLAELMQLKSLMDANDSMIITEKTKATSHPEIKTKYLIYGSRNEGLLKYGVKFLINSFRSLVYFLSFRPDIVVSTGVHSTIPIMLLTKLFRKKLIYIETIANVYTKTMTGNFIYKHADLFIVQWEELLDVYEDAVFGGSVFK
jgi:UDP-N-acetylglucosamine:LPS N-acetylglucosamine transferase